MTRDREPPVRLAYLVSHPIQYQAPLLRRIAQEPDIELLVLFGSDFSVRGYQDQGFGVEVVWDTPLLEGYRSRVLPALRDPGTVSAFAPLSRSLLCALRTADGRPAFDALWVHGYASLNALRAILAARALGIPVLLRAESWLGDRPRDPVRLLAKRSFLRGLQPLIAAVLPIGSHNAAYWRFYFGPEFPQFPMPYAVDNAFFERKASAAESHLANLRAEWDLEPGRPVIVFASKLQPRKHADHLLQAYRHLLARGQTYAPPYLLLIGDGEERSRLEAMAKDLDLPDVRFVGFRNQTELPRFFALSDVFVLPSRHEPWGLIVNEAMAAGCPVVLSTDVGAAADLVTEGVEGYTFPVGNVLALTRALERVLATPQTAAGMGAAARRRVGEWNFEADICGLRRALAAVTHRIRA